MPRHSGTTSPRRGMISVTTHENEAGIEAGHVYARTRQAQNFTSEILVSGDNPWNQAISTVRHAVCRTIAPDHPATVDDNNTYYFILF
jgi:hypothetical protein